MEEILASIRRIIAEGERDAQETGGERDRTEPNAPDPSKPPSAEISDAASQAEVLVLTEMVQDDGSVVSLQSAADSAPPQPDEASVDSLLRRSLLAEAPPSSAAAVSITTVIESVEAAVTPKATPPETPAAAPAAVIEVSAPSKPAEAPPDKMPAWLSPTPTPPPPLTEKPTSPPTDKERIVV